MSTRDFILSEGGGRQERRISGGTALPSTTLNDRRMPVAAPPEILRRFAAQDKVK